MLSERHLSQAIKSGGRHTSSDMQMDSFDFLFFSCVCFGCLCGCESINEWVVILNLFAHSLPKQLIVTEHWVAGITVNMLMHRSWTSSWTKKRHSSIHYPQLEPSISNISFIWLRSESLFNWNPCLATLTVTAVWKECINNSCIEQDLGLNILTQLIFLFSQKKFI